MVVVVGGSSNDAVRTIFGGAFFLVLAILARLEGHTNKYLRVRCVAHLNCHPLGFDFHISNLR